MLAYSGRRARCVLLYMRVTCVVLPALNMLFTYVVRDPRCTSNNLPHSTLCYNPRRYGTVVSMSRGFRKKEEIFLRDFRNFQDFPRISGGKFPGFFMFSSCNRL